MSFRADTVDDVRAALDQHKRTHAPPPRQLMTIRSVLPLRAPPTRQQPPAMRQPLGSRPALAPALPWEDPGVLARTPASSARVDLAAEIQVEFNALQDIARSGYTLAADSIFLPMEPPRSIGTTVHLVLVVIDRLFSLEGVVVAAYPDPADPRPTRGVRRGNGVFVTTQCSGWAAFCKELQSGFHDMTEPDHAPLREVVRPQPVPENDEFDE